MPPHFWVLPLRTFIINSITIAVAVRLFLNRRRNPEIVPAGWPNGEDAPKVEVIIPARNEVGNVAPLLRTLLQQRYPEGRWGVTLVDDSSTDDTVSEAHRAGGGRPHFRVVSAGNLPDGWTGKSHALYRGYLASHQDAQWLLFVDADTRHHPLMLSSLIRRALERQADLLSLIIDLQVESFWERLLVPQVGELYTLLVGPMDAVSERMSRTAANGQCLLVRRELFGEMGKEYAVRANIAEDRALAFALKTRGLNVRLDYGRRLVVARGYSGLGEMWSSYAKTLFWASGNDTTRALLVVTALSAYALFPLATLLSALAARRGAGRNFAIRHAYLQLGPMLVVRMSVCRLLRVPITYALLYPFAVMVGNALLLYSLFRVRSGRGVTWKGRTYY